MHHYLHWWCHNTPLPTLHIVLLQAAEPGVAERARRADAQDAHGVSRNRAAQRVRPDGHRVGWAGEGAVLLVRVWCAAVHSLVLVLMLLWVVGAQ